jgi:MoaA/NifB/PqqE/SkfB family radical SAM enzyme
MLFQGKPLTEKQQRNTDLNLKEIDEKATVLSSMPRRLVFELTNVCNLNCIMCGRNAKDFKPTVFSMDWFRYFEPMFDVIEEVTLMGWGEPTMHPNFEEMLSIIDNHSARKYFCTNGMRLDVIKDALFKYNVDVFGVSVDGATPETNNRIRRGSDLNKVVENLKEIVKIKNEKGLKYPWINFVFCAMKSNLHELPDLVKLAADIGIEEVKVVYLTAFDDYLADEVLWGCEAEVKQVFDEATRIGEDLGIILKLPYVQGEDVAEDKEHRDCFVSWRDFFLGSDGYIRPCMSTPRQFMKFDPNKNFDEFWNCEDYQKYRKIVNECSEMEESCKRCYQSSHCNWNKKMSFLQVNQNFAPEWKKN